MLINLLIKLLGSDWKSSLSGILSLLIATFSSLSAVIASLNGVHAAAWISVGLTIATGLCKAWLGLITKDAK